jgi:hypothetical protein
VSDAILEGGLLAQRGKRRPQKRGPASQGERLDHQALRHSSSQATQRTHLVAVVPRFEGGIMPIMGVAKFERFFRLAAGVDVDKSDLKRYQDFVYDKLYDLLLIGQAHAKSNGRDVLEPQDLPITKGLQERIHEFRDLDEEIELAPILEYLAARPPLVVELSAETQDRLVLIVGGLSVALAKTFKILDPSITTPLSGHWEVATQIFDLIM